MEATVFIRLARPQPSGGSGFWQMEPPGPRVGMAPWGQSQAGAPFRFLGKQHRQQTWEASVLHTCEWYPTLRVTQS